MIAAAATAAAAAGYSAPNTAIIGTHNIFGQPYPIGELQGLLTTTWNLVSSDNATAEQLAAAIAFVEAPFDMLDRATAGQLYQFSFTGVPDDEIASVPAHFAVANCHQSTVAIAEYVMAATLEWTVQLRAMDARLRNCSWRTAPPGNDCTATGARITHGQLSNRTIGILGYGHIGAAIAQRAAAFGTRLIATTVDPPPEPPAPLAWIGDDRDNARLFAEADFVVGAQKKTESRVSLDLGPAHTQRIHPLHIAYPPRRMPSTAHTLHSAYPLRAASADPQLSSAAHVRSTSLPSHPPTHPPPLAVCTPLLNSTRGLVGAELLAHMGRDAVLVNIARGAIVDEAALYDALSTGSIGGAILDVWWHPIFEMPDGARARPPRRALAWRLAPSHAARCRFPDVDSEAETRGRFCLVGRPLRRRPTPASLARPHGAAPLQHTPSPLPPPGSGGVGPSAWPSSYRFDELPNVIMTAHDSGETAGAAAESVREVATNLDRLARGLPPLNVIRNASAVPSASAATPRSWWTW